MGEMLFMLIILSLSLLGCLDESQPLTSDTWQSITADAGTPLEVSTLTVNTDGTPVLFSTHKAAGTDGLNIFIGGGGQFAASDAHHTYAGSTNTSLGTRALNALTTGYENTAIGRQALANNTSGFSNTAIGMTSGQALTTGGYDTLIGAQCGMAMTTANDNTAVGQLALASLTVGGNGNTVMGVQAMQNSNGNNAKQNVAIGLNALLNGLAHNNVIVGYEADHVATTANSTVAIGAFVLRAHTTGVKNTVVGETAAQDLTTGASNTIIGNRAGWGVASGSYNTIVGAAVQRLSPTLSNNVILADGAGTVRFQADSSGNVTSLGGPKNKGTLALTADLGTATVSVSAGSVCVCSDTTAVASVKCAVSDTTMTATGTPTDVISYLCF